jgi:hypothetical protein
MRGSIEFDGNPTGFSAISSGSGFARATQDMPVKPICCGQTVLQRALLLNILSMSKLYCQW